MRAALLVLLMAAAPGCLLGAVDGIPCGSDNQCPTRYWCDIPDETCVGVASAPALSILGLVDENGDTTRALFILPATPTDTALVLKNDGGADAESLRLELSPLSCLTMDLDPLPSHVEAGDELQVPLTLSGVPGCGRPMTIDWLLYFSGRGLRGTFDVGLLPPPSP